MRIGLLQLMGRDSHEASIASAREALSSAKAQGAEVAVLPEMFALPWFPSQQDSGLLRLAEPEDGPTVGAMRIAAAELQMAILVSFYERDGSDRLFNSAILVDQVGDKILKYRKNHIPQEPLWNEKFYFAPGDLGSPVVDLGGARIGVQVCWDNMFPEGARCLALGGATVVLAPTACGANSNEKWRAIIRGNAAANNIFVVRVNRAGPDTTNGFYGDSFVVDPEGDVVAEMGHGEETLVVDVDLQRVSRSRDYWPFLRDRRPETYTRICAS